MDGQLSMFPEMEVEQKKQRKATDRVKRKWEDGFQKWSDRNGIDNMNQASPEGCCGWGWMCDNCADNSYGRPCVRALNETCREKGITIDYENTTYEDAWYGRFRKEKMMALIDKQAAIETVRQKSIEMKGETKWTH